MPESERYPPDDIPSRHGSAIAVAVMAWADLEFEIDVLIWDLMDSPQALSACLTAQITSPISKLNALQSLVRLYEAGDELENKVSQFTGSLGSLIERRNRIVHDKRIWDPKSGKIRRINVTARKELKFQEEVETVGELKNFAGAVMEARRKFIEIRDRIIEHRDATRSLPSEQKPKLPRIIRRVVREGPAN